MRLTSAGFQIATFEVKPRIPLIERTREFALASVLRIDAQLKSLSKHQDFPRKFGEHLVDPNQISSFGFLWGHNSDYPFSRAGRCRAISKTKVFRRVLPESHRRRVNDISNGAERQISGRESSLPIISATSHSWSSTWISQGP